MGVHIDVGGLCGISFCWKWDDCVHVCVCDPVESVDLLFLIVPVFAVVRCGEVVSTTTVHRQEVSAGPRSHHR